MMLSQEKLRMFPAILYPRGRQLTPTLHSVRLPGSICPLSPHTGRKRVLEAAVKKDVGETSMDTIKAH